MLPRGSGSENEEIGEWNRENDVRVFAFLETVAEETEFPRAPGGGMRGTRVGCQESSIPAVPSYEEDRVRLGEIM